MGHNSAGWLPPNHAPAEVATVDVGTGTWRKTFWCNIHARQLDQNTSFIANCICRGFPTVDVICPSEGELTVALGNAKCGVFVKLNNSPRNSRRKRSPMKTLRPIIRSILC